MKSASNIVLLTDSYKLSHWKQYPKGSEIVVSYLESRKGGIFPETCFFGLQYVLKEYLTGEVITLEKIQAAKRFTDAHIGPGIFNEAGFMRLLEVHKGRLPISIRAVPEGLVVPTGNVLMTIENTDPEFYWLTNYLETVLLQLWAPITVASQSYHMKKVITRYLEKTGTPEAIGFKLHDFGFRGVSSVETAGILGASHLVHFLGSDTVAGVLLLADYYNAAGMPAFSIPASEHSTITSWGEEGEVKAMENMLDQYPEGLVACVSDSFDIEKACTELWGTTLRDKILARKGTLVVRPDSGEPVSMVLKVLGLLGEKFGTTVNAKGYRVLPDQVRVIHGDGINRSSLERILAAMEKAGWSADNVAFGSGGALLQMLNRDDLRFAIKCSAIRVNGQWKDVFKAPASDPTKESKRGRLKLVQENGSFKTVRFEEAGKDVLREVFRDGVLLIDDSIEDIRKRV